MSIPKLITLGFLVFLFSSCEEKSILPKPTGFLRLKYPKPVYEKSSTLLYQFETNESCTVSVNKKHWMRIAYPKLKATIEITYRAVDNNILELLNESKKLTMKHASRADAIYFDMFENKEEQVYGRLSNVTGNTASSLQFYITDSTKNFITGALYFKTSPNYDSIYPAIKYIEKDIIRLMNTAKWKNK